MYICKVFGKKFKQPTALGGHVRSAHWQSKAEGLPHGNNPETIEEDMRAEETTSAAAPVERAQTQLASSDEDPGVMERIRILLRKKYTPRQIKESYGYSPRTVDQVAEEFIEPEGKGEGGEHNDRERGLPVTTKGTEVVTPEFIMQELANGSSDWRLRLEGMMLLRAAQRMNRDDVEMTRMQAETDATRIKPILELMKETRLEQDAAAARAKESNIEIAERTAYDMASQMSPMVSQGFTKVTEGLNQMRQAVGGKEENPLGQLLNMMQSMQQFMGMFGISMPGMMPGQAQGGAPSAEQWQPPPITRRKLNESEEKDV